MEFRSPKAYRMSHLQPGRSCWKIGGRRCPRRTTAVGLGFEVWFGLPTGGCRGLKRLERLFAGLEIGLGLLELGLLSATDLDLSLFGAVVLGFGLDGRLGSVKCTDVMATVAVGLVEVEVQVVSCVLDDGPGCVVSLKLAVEVEDFG